MTTEPMTTAAPAAATETAAPHGVTGTTTESTPAAPASIDDQLSAIWDKNNGTGETPPATNNDAVAKALTGSEPEPSDEPELPLEPQSDLPEGKASEPASSPAIAAPNSWSADVKSVWNSIPPKAQEYIASREKEAHTKITQQGNELRAYQPVREIYEHIRTQGVPAGREPEVIANWARAQAALDQNPIEGLKWLAQSYRVDLSQLAGPQGDKPQDESIDALFRDPRFDRIAPEVNELRSVVGNLQRQLQVQKNAEIETQTQQVSRIIADFSARDEVRDHWPDLQDDVAHEIEVVRAREPNLPYEKLLEKAFDRALHANPESRARLQADQQRKQQEANEAQRRKEAEEAVKKAAQAKKLSSMNVRTGATASTSTHDGKWDDKDNLGRIYDRVQSGSR
jgi:hypothetical protein